MIGRLINNDSSRCSPNDEAFSHGPVFKSHRITVSECTCDGIVLFKDTHACPPVTDGNTISSNSTLTSQLRMIHLTVRLYDCHLPCRSSNFSLVAGLLPPRRLQPSPQTINPHTASPSHLNNPWRTPAWVFWRNGVKSRAALQQISSAWS